MIARRILGTLVDSMRKAFLGRAPAAVPVEPTPAPAILVCRTHDEMNGDLARTWCDTHGIDFELAGERDPLLPDRARALVLDVNHLGLAARERGLLLERLCQVLPPYPVAIASYEVSPEMRARLVARGWLVFRHLENRLFYELVAPISAEVGDHGGAHYHKLRWRKLAAAVAP